MTLRRSTAPAGTGWVAAAKHAWELARELRNTAVEHVAWSVRIESDDAMYEPVLDWVAGLTGKVSSQRQLSVVSGRRRAAAAPAAEHVESARAPEIRLMPGTASSAHIQVGGHRVWVTLGRRDVTADDSRGYRPATENLTFRALTEAGRDAVVAAIRELADAQATRQPVLRLRNQWGGWDTRSDLPPRTLDSVILPAEQKAFVVADLDRFLRSEADYVRRGVPYHRGYLLHGPPGTGKSSLAQALASHFRLDLWYAGLADARRDADLIHQLSQVTPRSVLLLEDIDVFAAATQRHTDGDGPSMASLLNVLDGVATPHGLITFITTNVKAELDPALVRPGRVDVDLELGAPTWELAEQLWRWFYGMAAGPGGFDGLPIADSDLVFAEPAAIWRFGRGQLPSSAEIVELFKRHPDDPAAGHAALVEAAQR